MVLAFTLIVLAMIPIASKPAQAGMVAEIMDWFSSLFGLDAEPSDAQKEITTDSGIKLTKTQDNKSLDLGYSKVNSSTPFYYVDERKGEWGYTQAGYEWEESDTPIILRDNGNSWLSCSSTPSAFAYDSKGVVLGGSYDCIEYPKENLTSISVQKINKTFDSFNLSGGKIKATKEIYVRNVSFKAGYDPAPVVTTQNLIVFIP